MFNGVQLTVTADMIYCIFSLFESTVWGEKFEAEDMNVVRCTSGETFAQKLAEERFGEPGQFSSMLLCLAII
jgi:hypothetical protein